MDTRDFYYSIANKARTEIKIKGSRFIASVRSATSKEEAMDFINQMRAEFYNATHNCFAYRFGENGLEYRFSDDGEPSGSAGKPILYTIKKFELSDIALVVTRFFGGTKLGIGPLARAYSQVAEDALMQTLRKQIHITTPHTIFCTYEDIANVKRTIEQYAISFTDEYTDSVRFIAEIPKSLSEEFIQRITAVTNARAGVVK